MVLRKSSNAFNKTFFICLPGNLMLFWSSTPRVRNTLQKLSRFLSFCHAEISYSFLDLSATLKKEKEFHRFKIVRYVCSYPSRQKLLTPHKGLQYKSSYIPLFTGVTGSVTNSLLGDVEQVAKDNH